MLDAGEEAPSPAAHADMGCQRLFDALAARDPQAPALAGQAMRTMPGDHDAPLLAPLIMVMARHPFRALVYLKRPQKRWVAGKWSGLLTALALALAQQGTVTRAGAMLEQAGVNTLPKAFAVLPKFDGMSACLSARLNETAAVRIKPSAPHKTAARPQPEASAKSSRRAAVMARAAVRHVVPVSCRPRRHVVPLSLRGTP